ncbi:MAG: glycosyltransferase family 39 protein [Candidatus Kaiserbacteria bacterium]|nr:MAG: glycosyltransferase family 39 protein [Candidatus Kaiserbacteria bacterium]
MRVPRSLVVLIAVAIIVRLGAFWFAIDTVGIEGFVRGDAIGYVELATNLSHGNGFVASIQGVPTTEVFRTPGLPLLIAPFTFLPSGVLAYGFFMSILAGALLPMLTYALGRRVAGESAGMIAATLLAFEPHAVMYSFLPQTEVPFMIFSLAGLAATIVAHERLSYLYAVFAGALLAYAAFIRPGLFPIFAVLAFGTIAFQIYRRDRFLLTSAILLVFVASLIPWHVRNYAVSGAFALSGQGWRNVYTDYVSSVRSLENDTPYYEEKEKLKQEALPRFGITRAGVNDPKNANILRDAALKEMWEHKFTVLKLEAALLTTFFFNDGYYYEFRYLGYLTDSGAPHISPTYEILRNGLGALPAITGELARQAFIPLWGRFFTIGTFALAAFGFFLVRTPVRYVLIAAIGLFALTSTAIGLGLDARLRIPVEPLIFIFASAAIVWLSQRVRSFYASRYLHSRVQ